MKNWWLSFRDVDKNRNTGCCMVQAVDREMAIGESWLRGCNPGGEVLFHEMSDEMTAAQGLEMNKLYSRDFLRARGFEKVKAEELHGIACSECAEERSPK